MASSPGAGMASAPPPPDRASLGRAVAALYTSHDPVERLAADEWLQHFLRSDHAWPLSIELLRDATDLTSLEALFCARALHVLLRKSVVKASRTQKSHAVLGENDWVAMRDALLALAWSFSAKVFVGTAGGSVEAPPRSVLTQVSLAISALACKMDNWDPGSVAVDIVRHFTNDGSNQTGQTTTRAPTAARVVASRHPLVRSSTDAATGAVALCPVGEALLGVAGEACIVSILAVLPEEAVSKNLSIHPKRRADVVDGLRLAATTVAFPALDQLAAKYFSNVGADPTPAADHHARAAVLRAAAAWASFDENQEGACPGAALDRAAATITAGADGSSAEEPSAVIDAAVTLATAALAGAVHRPARRHALAEKLSMLRASACGGGRMTNDAYETERRARAAEVLASVACRAADPPPAPVAPPDAFGTGPNAAPDRAYVPHKEFSKLRKAKKRSDKRDDRRAAADGSKPPPLAGADAEVLCFCLDALCDAMACEIPGASPAAALQPWTEMAAAFESFRACGGRIGPPANELVSCARRVAAAAAASAPRWFPKEGASAANDGDAERFDDDDDDDDDDRENAANREDLAEGLRDIACVVGPDVFLALAVEGFAKSAEGGSAPVIEGWTFVLFACARLVTKQHAETSRDVANVTRLAVRVAGAAIRGNVSTRAVELCAWILGGLAKSVSGCIASSSSSSSSDGGRVSTEDAREILLEALDGVLCASRSPSPSVARGACVAAMRLLETNAAAVASGRFDAACAHLLDAYRSGTIAAPPPHALRRGQEPVSTILARGLAAVAAAREPASEADAAAASLAAPAAEAASRAAEALRRACQSASATASLSPDREVLFNEALHAGLALYVALVETRVTVEACLASSRRASLAAVAERHGAGTGDRLAGKRALRDAVFPAVIAAVEASREARPLFARCGFGTDANSSFGFAARQKARRKSIGSLRGTSDILEAAAALVRAAVTSSPDTETFADAARLAAEAYAADSERHYHFLAAIVDACRASSARADAEEREVWTNSDARTIEHKRSVAAEASLAVLRVAFLAETPGRGPGTFTPRLPESPEARVAAYVAAQAAIRAGCASLRVPVSLVHDTTSHSAEVPFFAVLAHVSLVSLTLETSGEEALAALALAADVASAASFLAPATFAPGRSDEQTRAATAVHPGMGRLASAMSGDSSRGAHLPRWAVGEDHSRALAETAAETLTTSEGSGSGSGLVFFRRDGEEDAAHVANASRGSRLIRAMFRCACGSMPPGMVTDVSAALFATWAACGDHVFGTWLAEALGGDKDGFPRRSTTREQKAFFARELLGTLGDVPGDAPERTAPREASPEAKMDLRRFKRCVKAFCGGKKVGK